MSSSSRGVVPPAAVTKRRFDSGAHGPRITGTGVVVVFPPSCCLGRSWHVCGRFGLCWLHRPAVTAIRARPIPSTHAAVSLPLVVEHLDGHTRRVAIAQHLDGMWSDRLGEERSTWPSSWGDARVHADFAPLNLRKLAWLDSKRRSGSCEWSRRSACNTSRHRPSVRGFHYRARVSIVSSGSNPRTTEDSRESWYA